MSTLTQEQDDEVQVLKSMYVDEYSQMSTEPFSFKILVKQDECQVDLMVTFPPDYPAILPFLSLKSPIPKSLPLDKFTKQLNSAANENLGMPMIFTLVCLLQEILTTFNQEAVKQKEADAEAEHQKKLERIAAANIDEKMPDFPTYTPFNRESFLKWKERFEKELRIKNGEDLQAEKEKKQRPTGRQLFEADTTLMTSDAAFTAEDEVAIDIGLFENMETLEIESSDDEENK